MIIQSKESGERDTRYRSPQVEVVRISIRAHLMQASIGGNPNVNGYGDGSDSNYDFGDFSNP